MGVRFQFCLHSAVILLRHPRIEFRFRISFTIPAYWASSDRFVNS